VSVREGAFGASLKKDESTWLSNSASYFSKATAKHVIKHTESNDDSYLSTKSLGYKK
jgi:hypothetical protein